MANKKITGLNTIDNVQSDDLILVYDSSGSVTGKMSISTLLGGWRDLRAPLLGGKNVGVSDPALKAFGPTGNVKQYNFDVGDEVMLAFHIDHDIKIASTIYPHVHWSTDGASTNTVKWEVNMTIAERNDVTPAVFGAETQFLLEAAATANAWDHIVTEDPTGFLAPAVDALVLVHLKRISNGGSENADDVFGLFMDLHYECQQYGTVSRAPNFYTA